MLFQTYRSLVISPCDEFKLCTDWWCICAWCVSCCGAFVGVFSFVDCLYRLRLKKSDKTAFNRPEQMSFAVIVSRPPIWFCFSTARHASTLSNCNGIRTRERNILEVVRSLFLQPVEGYTLSCHGRVSSHWEPNLFWYTRRHRFRARRKKEIIFGCN